MESQEYFNFTNKTHVVIKCLPILSLIGEVIGKFKSFSDLRHNKHGLFIFVALSFSVMGDALLVYDDDINFFVAGLSMFMLTALSYVQAFGWKNLNLKLLPVTLILFMSMYQVVFEELSEIPVDIKQWCLLYILIGQTAVWRAWARIDWREVKKGQYKDLLAAIGVVSFAISDFTIAVNKFAFPIRHSRYIVMSTYYFAQHAISSAVTSENEGKRIS